ncbi:MAG: hypothetical protein LCH54_10320 [Bacteroidetes bacterium]|nr:hypothetical protein [Bacteroidota bacterium]
MKFLSVLLLFLVHVSASFAQTGDYLLLEDSTIISGTFKVNDDIFISGGVLSFTLDKNLENIKGETVIAYQKGLKFYRKYVFKNSALKRGLFIPRIEKGKIDLYQLIVINKMPRASLDGKGNWTYGNNTSFGYRGPTSKENYISINNGPLQKADNEKLTKLVASCPEAVKLLTKEKKLRYWTYGLLGAGAVTVGVTAATLDKNVDSVPPGFIVGGIIAVLSWIPYLMQEDLTQDVVVIYNKSR